MTATAAVSDQVAIRFVAESTFGTVEPGNPTMQLLRVTGESLGLETSITESQEIVSDRQTSELIRTQIAAPGDVNFELSYGTYDDLLRAALQSAAWSSAVTIAAGTDVAFSAAAGTTQAITKTAGGFNTFTVGMWIKVAGAAAANSGIFKISTIVSDTGLTVENSMGTLEAAGSSIDFEQGGQVVNGTSQETFNFEREYTDLTNEIAVFTGVEIDGLVLNFAADQLITGSLNLLAKDEKSSSATLGDGSPTPSTTTSPMNAVDNVTGIWEGNAMKDMTAFAINVRNNLRDRNVIGTLGACGRGAGKFGLTGTFQKFYESKTIMDKHINQTATELAVVIQDGAGNAYVVHMPQVKLIGGKRVSGGINTDIVADMSWQAYKDPTYGITMRIQRFAA